MTLLTRAASAIALSGLLATSAIAAPTGPLPSGKPAGVEQAALTGPGLILIGAGVIIAVAVAVSVSGGNDGVTTPTTTTTP